ncbi:MAG: hypothetical protein ACFFCI_25955 [Promethearchaeota archaeon]
MKISYLIFLIIISAIEVILVVLLFYYPESNVILILLMIGAPVIVPVSYYVYTSFEGTPLSKEDEQRPLTYKEFLVTNPYFCGRCSNYTSYMLQHCENCGAENSLRKTAKKDYKQYLKKHSYLFKA